MALVIEDGTGKADANSYISAADAASYLQSRGDAVFNALEQSAQEVLLLQAMDFMAATYADDWDGSRVTAEQALDWPRVGVRNRTVKSVGGYGGTVYYPQDKVPAAVGYAQAELALKAKSGPLVSDLKQGKKSVKVGPIAVEYDIDTSRQTFYASVNGKLSAFFGGPDGMTQIVRT